MGREIWSLSPARHSRRISAKPEGRVLVGMGEPLRVRASWAAGIQAGCRMRRGDGVGDWGERVRVVEGRSGKEVSWRRAIFFSGHWSWEAMKRFTSRVELSGEWV